MPNHRAILLAGQGVLLALALLGAPSPRLHAQATFPEGNGAALVGVRAFDAKAAVFTWLNMPEDRAAFVNRADSVFRASLPPAVTVDASAPNYLFCELWVADASGLIAFAWNVSYYIHELSGVHRLDWRTGGMITIGRNNFSAPAATKVCVDAFLAEWTRRNPR